MSKNHILLLIVSLAVVFAGIILVSAAPNGANITAGAPQTYPNDAEAGSDDAYAGNITGLTIKGVSTTQTWQGYFGNVTGTIQLANSQSKVMYNWSLASPSGEIYASTNDSITWSSIQCFNFTATGEKSGAETAGSTSLYGTNLTELEGLYDIALGDADGVDETFVSPGDGHSAFYTASNAFVAGECSSTAVFDSTGKSADGNFEEVLLYEPTTTSIVFASLLENNQGGFDTGSHDFEMLVPENGHNGNTDVTPYYFFVELS